MSKLTKAFHGVKKEMSMVHFPNKKEMVKYSIATFSFIILFMIFFTGVDFIIAGLKVLFH